MALRLQHAGFAWPPLVTYLVSVTVVLQGCTNNQGDSSSRDDNFACTNACNLGTRCKLAFSECPSGACPAETACANFLENPEIVTPENESDKGHLQGGPVLSVGFLDCTIAENPSKTGGGFNFLYNCSITSDGVTQPGKRIKVSDAWFCRLQDGQATHTFDAGEIGIAYDNTGIVQEVSTDWPAHIKGIKKGDIIVKVGTEPYSKEALVFAENSGFGFEVTFQVSGCTTPDSMWIKKGDFAGHTSDPSGLISGSIDTGDDMRWKLDDNETFIDSWGHCIDDFSHSGRLQCTGTSWVKQ